MGFQREICLILCFSWSILVKFCVNLQTSTSKTQMLLLEKKMFHKYWLFCYRFITLTFDLCGLGFCILLVIRKKIPKTMKLLCWLIRAPDQIPDRFYVISMEFLLLRCRHLSWHNVLNNETAMLTNQSAWPDSRQILCHQYGISVAEVQTSLLT